MDRNPFSDDSTESDEDAQTPTCSVTPGPRASAVQLYRQSSSAARRLQLKATHCLFCNQDVNRRTFENHLRGSDHCLSLYKRKLHVRSIDSILVHSFYCIFCDSKSKSKFQHHLEQSPGCLESYINKFHVDSMRFEFFLFIFGFLLNLLYLLGKLHKRLVVSREKVTNQGTLIHGQRNTTNTDKRKLE